MIEKVLEERGSTHGSFEDNAYISQTIKMAISRGKPMNDLPREALDMIALKISRIASGKWEERDHWLDIVGYATLVINFIDSRKQ